MSKLSANFKSKFNHEMYHGWFKKKRFFEGWYFKVVDKLEQHALAIIPGIAMDAEGNKQSFIQVLDGVNVTAAYHKFDAIRFKPSDRRFKVNIKDNSFTQNRIKIDVPGVKGLLHFDEHFFWPKKWYAPGIMGWYSWVPFMECYHQVVSMNSSVTGKLLIKNNEVDFVGGRAYIEKDWGKSFPSSWIWMQSNHFTDHPVSFKLSVAKIPWLSGAFVGFICAFLIKDKFIRFATYTGAKLKKVSYDDDAIDIVLEDPKYILTVKAIKAAGAELASPVLGLMDGRVKESMRAVIHINLFSKAENKVIFNDSGRNAGLEIAGNTTELLNF